MAYLKSKYSGVDFDSAFPWVTSGHGTSADAVCDIGKLRLMRFTGTSGASASDYGAGTGQVRYYIQISISFGYTFSSAPMTIWHCGSFDDHRSAIATTNTSTTGATAYTHAYIESSIESKAFTVLVVGEN